MFALSHVLAIRLVNEASDRFGIEPEGGVNMGMFAAAIAVTSISYTKAYGRAPDRSERRKLTWGSLFSSVLISLAAAWMLLTLEGEDPAAAFSEVVDKLTPILFGVAVIIGTLVYYVLMGIGYWVMGKVAEKVAASND